MTATLFHAITGHGNGWWFTGTRIVAVTELLPEGGCKALVVADIPAIDDEDARAYDPDTIFDRALLVTSTRQLPAYPVTLTWSEMLHAWDEQAASQFRRLRDTYRRIHGIPRPILHTGEVQAHDWPAGTYVQGGKSGTVFKREGGSYRTAFVEAMLPDQPDGDRGPFIRGEGDTLAEAEAAAYAKWQRTDACPGHEYETRGYRNGAGLCKHCDRFATGVFDVKVVGHPCAECGEGTNYFMTDDDQWLCEAHAEPHMPRCKHGAIQISTMWAEHCDCDEGGEQ